MTSPSIYYQTNGYIYGIQTVHVGTLGDFAPVVWTNFAFPSLDEPVSTNCSYRRLTSDFPSSGSETITYRYDSRAYYRIVDFVNTLTATDTPNPVNTVSDSTPIDSPCSTLYVGQNSANMATVTVTFAWDSSLSNSILRWAFTRTDGSASTEWINGAGAFASNTITAVWTNVPNAARDFNLWAWYDMPNTQSGPGGLRANGIRDATEPHRMVKVSIILKMDIVPDYNHDRKIDDSDRGQVTPSTPFRFWINDDGDVGDVAGAATGDSYDCPIDLTRRIRRVANYERSSVWGRRDLVDFFPVWLDLGEVLNLYPPGPTVRYRLKHRDGAVKAVYTDLTKEHAGDYLTTESPAYGPAFNQNAHTAQVFQVTSGGQDLSPAFLNRIRNDPTKGVLLMEGAGQTMSTAPLVLELLKDGTVVYQKQMPLSLSSVTKMFRYLNLRPVCQDLGARATDVGEPLNNPDSLCNTKHLVFIHGFNETVNSSLGNMCETFKRFYWAGSKAKYTGVTWRGDMSALLKPSFIFYHEDVCNAFITAPYLANYMLQRQAVGDEVQVFAFSLGNMVASSAIQDYNVRPSKYYMVHAAMPKCAYDPAVYDPLMVHNTWRAYPPTLYASEWHHLWDSQPTDGRHDLTWVGRFSPMVSTMGGDLYNYYSSGEDVLDNLTDGGMTLPEFITQLWSASPLGTGDEVGRYAWCFQELWKGLHNWAGGTRYGGWAFTSATEYCTNSVDADGTDICVLFAPDRAALIPPNDLKTSPFFNATTPIQHLLDKPGENGSSYATNNRDFLLGMTIPAISWAVGADAVDTLLGGPIDRNVDMNTAFQNGWPSPGTRTDTTWRHGDFRSVAYPYVFRFFTDIVTNGGLK